MPEQDVVQLDASRAGVLAVWQRDYNEVRSISSAISAPPDFGAARARAGPWVLNPLVDWARSFLLSDAYLA
jgi:hypothetical protein